MEFIEQYKCIFQDFVINVVQLVESHDHDAFIWLVWVLSSPITQFILATSHDKEGKLYVNEIYN